ncbi:malto-oligosyltrehalose synthase [Pseudonocardia benzenivorans]
MTSSSESRVSESPVSESPVSESPVSGRPARHVPSSTYRLQFSAQQTFAHGVALLDYLDALGVGALYASPLLESGAGSNHGYDVVDPTRVSAERGGELGRKDLVAALRERGLGLLLDIVPNHVGVDVPLANPWWWDVLTHGRSSRHAAKFDVDWDAGPVLLPVLGEDENEALDALVVSPDRTELRYYEHAFPVAPGTADGTAREVHERQHYRLVSWKRGAAELTYRRFFDVSTLAAVRVEDPDVFEATHAEVLRWVAAGEVDGIRVDHPDGLSHPGEYLQRLRAAIGPDRWLLVEKILGVGEELPASWPVDGTTGYEALRHIGGVFVDPAGAGLLTQFTAEHVGSKESAHSGEHRARREVASTILAAEVRRIAGVAAAVPAVAAALDGAPEDALGDAVAELLCGFPVYRSYLPEGREALDTALTVARTHRPDLAPVLLALHAAMLADPHGELTTRVQQTSGMIMAKGVEDTAFYRWNRFVALNEVGGAPTGSGSPRRVPRRRRGPRGEQPRDDDDPLDTRHQALRGRARPARGALGDAHRVDRRGPALVGAPPAARPVAGPAGLAVPRRRVADPGRPDGGLPDEGVEGGQARHQPRRGRGRGRRGRRRVGGRGALRSRPGRRDRGVRRPDRGPWPVELTGPEAAAAGRAGRSRHLPGHRVLRVLPRRPRQPPSRGLRRPPCDARPSRRGRAARDRPGRRREAAGDRHRGAVAPVPARALRRVPGAAGLGTGGRARRRVRAWHGLAARAGRAGLGDGRRRHPAPGGAGGPRGWGDTVLPLPDGADDWHDILTDTPVDGAAPRLGDLLLRYPVALLVRPA